MVATRDELRDWLRLLGTPGVGNDTARRLLQAFGLPGQVLAQSASAWRQVVPARGGPARGRTPPA
ncbi:MAG: DNA-protecting protein DprA, partial [Limnohabitans sp.]